MKNCVFTAVMCAVMAGTTSADVFTLANDLRITARPTVNTLLGAGGLTVSEPNFRANVEFDLTDEIALAGSQVVSATWTGSFLTFGSFSATGVEYFAYTGSTENFADRPLLHDITDTEGGFQLFGGTPTDIVGTGVVNFSVDVTAAIQSILDGGGSVFGGQIRGTTSQNFFVQGTNLEIELVPTPGTAAMAGLAGALAIRRRRA
ncbi:MAG: hypothetical protein AAGI30_07400 [Planctomycetota bacterium]